MPDTPEDETPAALPQLLEAVRDEAADLDAAVTAAVALENRQGVVDALGQILLDKSEEAAIRLRAAYGLSLLDDERAVPVLGQALTSDADAGVRQISLGALERLDVAGSALFFQQALNDKVGDIRRSALGSLGLAARYLAQIMQGDMAAADKEAARQIVEQITLPNLEQLLTEDSWLESEEASLTPQAAAALLGLRGEPAIPILCRYLHKVQQAQELAERSVSHESAAAERELDWDRNRDRVVLSVITALREIGSKEVVPCLSETAQRNHNFRVRRLAISALHRLGFEEAIPALMHAFLSDDVADVRQLSGTALASFPQWQKKVAQLIQLLRRGNQQRSQIDGAAIVQALQPPPAELDANPHLLTDYLIGQALDNRDNERMLALLAALIIGSADSSMSLAAERLDLYVQTAGISEEQVRDLRVEIGGAKALTPILSQLEANLKNYFQEPIKLLNSDTRQTWRRTIAIAYIGFGLRALLSVVLFGIGAYLTVDSYGRLVAGALPVEAFLGPGVTFIAGIGAMAATVFRGPLREIRQAVGDAGAANAAFIAYIHRILQISHTFSYYYLQGKISFQELEKVGKLIDETLVHTVKTLRDEKGKEND